MKEKDKDEKMKDNLRSKNEKYKIMRLSRIKSKNLPTENQIFGLIIIMLLLKLKKEIMKIMNQMMEKKEKKCLQSIVLKLFDLIPMILFLIFSNF